MSWLWIPAILAGAMWAQETKPATVLPKDVSPAEKQQSGKPAEDPQLPPEEDASAIPQQYSFNPVRSKRDVEVGNFYFKKGDWKAAAARFREATLWNEGNAEAWLRWGEAEEKRGSVKAAKSAYQKYVELAPDGKTSAEVKKRLEKLK
jgi:tetratricopeptide (TPR) repeat protein